MERVVSLTSSEAKNRLAEFGPNIIQSGKIVSPIFLFLSQFPSGVNLILAFACILSFSLGEVVDGGFILAILVLNAVFGFVQEFRAEKAVSALRQFVVEEARVVRDGVEQVVKTSEIVPGDLIILNEGDKIPADGILIDGVHFEVDESVLTGESLPALKTTDKEPQLFMGTTVTTGRGRMLIEKTGASTRFGEIAKTLSTVKKEKTPLERQIEVLGKQLAVGIVAIAGLIILVASLQGREFLSTLFTAVSVAVAGIPEGLPAVITIALALGMQRMAKRKALVRKMAAIETLGAVSVILTDKTGTLTENKMRVKKIWHEGNEQSRDLLIRGCVLGNTASFVKNGETVGDKTDGALLMFAKEQKGNLDIFTKEGQVIDEYVFDPATKTVTTLWKNNEELVIVRGAPESILETSTHIFWGGKKILLTQKSSDTIQNAIEKFAKEGLRVIGFGFREVVNGGKLKREQLEKNLTFLGFVGIYDRPRPETKEAVREARLAGIHTVMVTGDNPITALAIAKEIGLLEKEEEVITGKELRAMSDQEILQVLKKIRVFARTTPLDKLRLVELFKRQGNVVGVTGDGVNDALALKRADVGVAMGKTGTDVAKEASDIVITDDNFASLVSAIEEGRNIYNNIVKAITFLISANLAEVGMIFFAILLGLPVPLLPTQILWMNLVSDGLPALALASDTKDPHILHHSPRNPGQHIINSHTIHVILIGAFIMAAIALVAFVFTLRSIGIDGARVVTFNLMIGMQMIFIFIVRGRKHPLNNRFLLATITLTILVQIIIMVSPPLRAILHF